MACCSDIGSGALANVLPSLLKKVVQELKFVISLPQSFRDMEHEVERLNNLRHDINVELARVQMNPKRVVKAWLDKVGEAIASSESIRTDYEQHRRCLSWCPNCLGLYRISKDIRDWKATVAQLHSEKDSDFPPTGEYGDSNPPAQLQILTPEAGFVGNAIQSLQSVVEEKLTEDSNNRIIGVYGMGGVGKTSLLQTINNSLKVRSSFDPIIWVTVSKDYDISSLQDCIAHRLNLHNFPPKSDLEGRKQRLFSYLGDKKFLLLLDDLWKTLDLQSLGVSMNDTGSKVVLTTRNKRVCTSMEAKDPIKVEPLSEEEGWRLFSRRANAPQEIEGIARQIAGECKGLPLAINVVAAAMADKVYPHEWEHALLQMQNVDKTFYELHEEMDEKVFRHLKWSYDVLLDYLKTCFVYFAAYPEDTEIYCEGVIDTWIADDLVKSSGESYLPDTAHSFIDFLRDRCLIEVVHMDGVGRVMSVKIHDVIRDLAILIAQKEHRCFFKAGQAVSHFPSEIDTDGCARMSLMTNALPSLPTTFRCSSLSVLLLRENPGIEEIPGSFLNELPSLRVLDLSKTGIKSLPPTIGNLKHLSSLQLQHTSISELPESIGDLKELQFLNLYGCEQLRCLPERISELKRLRYLDVTWSGSLKHLPRWISELPSLRVLDLSGTRIQSLPPTIGNLKHLSSLQLQGCRSIRELPESIGDLKELQFLNLYGCMQLRCLPERISELKRLRALGISQCNRLEHLPRGISELVSLERLQCAGIALDFEEEEEALDAERKKACCIKDLRSLSSLRVLEVGIKSALKEGVMRNWSKMRHLRLLYEEAVGQDYLPQDMQVMKHLERLSLDRCHVERLPGWVTQFRKLAYLCLSECKQLKELPGELPCLRTLVIFECSKLEALELGMGFPKLQELGLYNLESLECVGPVGAASGSGGLGPLPPMLKSLDVGGCLKLKRLRGGWDKLECLEKIVGERGWWDAIEWDEPTMKTSLDGKFKSRGS